MIIVTRFKTVTRISLVQGSVWQINQFSQIPDAKRVMYLYSAFSLLDYIGFYDSSSRTNVLFVTSAQPTMCSTSVNIFYRNLFV